MLQKEHEYPFINNLREMVLKEDLYDHLFDSDEDEEYVMESDVTGDGEDYDSSSDEEKTESEDDDKINSDSDTDDDDDKSISEDDNEDEDSELYATEDEDEDDDSELNKMIHIDEGHAFYLKVLQYWVLGKKILSPVILEKEKAGSIIDNKSSFFL